jgi:hypothetical protein
LLVAGAGGLAAAFGTSSGPRIPSVGAADSLAPWLQALIGELAFPVSASGLLLAAAILSSRRRVTAVLVASLFVVGAALGRASTADPTAAAILVAAVLGALAWLVYRSQIRDRPWLVAPIVLCLTLIGQVAALFAAPYPQARLDTILGLVSTLIGYRIWRWLVDRDGDRDDDVSMATPREPAG